jgi:hypothetical protein
MGMPISIHLRGEDVDSPMVAHVLKTRLTFCAKQIGCSARTEQDSEVSRIRRGELDPAQADPLVQQVIALCHQAGELTEGAFTDRLSG